MGRVVCAFFLRADDILRRRPWVTRNDEPRAAFSRLVATIVVFGMLYGAVLGSYGGFLGDRSLQVVYAAVKVPLLLGATFFLCLPVFYVLNGLIGLHRDFFIALRALAATQAGMAIVLASLAPITALWYASFGDYGGAILFNALIFAVASCTAQVLLRGYYGPLIRRDGRHRIMLWTWLVVFAFVGIQMGWILRPFVGDKGIPVTFLRPGALGNAYVVVYRLILQAVGLE